MLSKLCCRAATSSFEHRSLSTASRSLFPWSMSTQSDGRRYSLTSFPMPGLSGRDHGGGPCSTSIAAAPCLGFAESKNQSYG